MTNRPWLITGGAGYIGSHVIREFQSAEIPVVVMDDLSTGLVERIPGSVPFVQANCAETRLTTEVMQEHEIVGVIHLAAFKQARESRRLPARYWSNNVGAMLGVMNACVQSDVQYFVLSSSCSIYGAQGRVTIQSPRQPQSPYARTKLVSEEILKDVAEAHGTRYAILRYFNVVGNEGFPMAHDTSKECIVPASLDRIMRGEEPQVFGDDFPTPDGTALRDYVDVRDLARAHLLAARMLMESDGAPELTVNIGTGSPTSVAEILTAMSEVLGMPIKYASADRNPADPDAVWADTDQDGFPFQWEPTFGIVESVRAHVTSAQKHRHLTE